jgi:hypothetical protein
MDLDLIFERIRDAAIELAYENMMNDGMADPEDEEAYDEHYDMAMAEIISEINNQFGTK